MTPPSFQTELHLHVYSPPCHLRLHSGIQLLFLTICILPLFDQAVDDTCPNTTSLCCRTQVPLKMNNSYIVTVNSTRSTHAHVMLLLTDKHIPFSAASKCDRA